MTLGMMPEPGTPAETRRGRHVGRWLVLAIALVVSIGALVAKYRVDGGASTPPQDSLKTLVMDTSARPPDGVRVRVRIVNTTSARGLAKRATFVLRDFGYDVVDYDGDPKAARKTTLIISHTGHADWAQRLQRALGTGSIEARADTLRYVDFTVLLGSDWTPPAQPFRP
ncbi:MAG TPA: LytR C-terminal domain-containing protein [Casimicrobiaceae bacterium]|nr:LytR C-terminal domain-containing protein [Casimicrobiaceae bacterium]